MNADAKFVKDMVLAHHEWFDQCIPLIASENVMSPLAREMLTCDFGHRYAEGHPGARYYRGCKYIDEVELHCIEMAKKLFGASYVDVRPLSGTDANMGVLFALAKPGDTITAVSVPGGAHISHGPFGAVGVRALNLTLYPSDLEHFTLDVDGTIKVLREARPKIALFGQSVFLFPTPLRELQEVIADVGAYPVYDAAHVLGLIAGGKFQDPLREGAEILTSSTHKTFPGPQHGIIIANPRDERTERHLDFGVFPGVLSNHHLHHLAALGITLAEVMTYGKEYADQTVKNAKALGQALYERGFAVMAEDWGFTESHTLVVDVSEHGGGKWADEAMEKANIITNRELLPWDDVSKAMEPSGIRLGSQELTRIGMGEGDMVDVAELIKKVVIDRVDPEKVKESVIELRRGYRTCKYCFNEGEAYRHFELV